MGFLKELRDKNDWTQEQLGKKIGESLALINNFERTDEDRKMNGAYALKLAELTDSHPLVMQWATNEGLRPDDIRFNFDRTIKTNKKTDYDGKVTEPILKNKADLFFQLIADSLDKKLSQENEKRRESLNNYSKKAAGPWPYDYALPFMDSGIQNEVVEDALQDAARSYFAVYDENYPRVATNAKKQISDEALTINELFDLIDDMETAAMKAKASEPIPDKEGDKKTVEELSVNELVELIKEKTKPESRDIPRVVLNSRERQSLVENLTVNDKCPLDAGSLKSLATNELKGLAELCKPVEDYSGRGVAKGLLDNKNKVPSIVLNESKND